MKHLNIVQLSVDDWSALYVNDEVFDQGHSIEFDYLLKDIIGQEIIIDSFEDHYIDLDESNADLGNYGNQFPEKLEDCVEYMNIINPKQ